MILAHLKCAPVLFYLYEEHNKIKMEKMVTFSFRGVALCWRKVALFLLVLLLNFVGI